MSGGASYIREGARILYKTLIDWELAKQRTPSLQEVDISRKLCQLAATNEGSHYQCERPRNQSHCLVRNLLVM